MEYDIRYLPYTVSPILKWMIQAACEVFERYTQIQIIQPETIVPSIDKETVENDHLKSMMAYYEKENVEIVLKDCSLDGLIPSIGVLFINHNLGLQDQFT